MLEEAEVVPSLAPMESRVSTIFLILLSSSREGWSNLSFFSLGPTEGDASAASIGLSDKHREKLKSQKAY